MNTENATPEMPTFGQTIRGLRMGFGWCHRHGCYVRLSRTEKEDIFRCEVHPTGLIPNRRDGGQYIAWWPDFDRNVGLNLSEIDALRHLRKAKRPFVFYFDGDGKTK